MKRTLRSLRRRISKRKRAVGTPRASTGFTLVEMLVAVALTLLIMTLFAQIFQIAAGTMTVQRGIAENDQRARMLMTTLRGDLDKRTFREVRPFQSGEDTRLPGANIANRAGYFYYAENDPLDDTDDVLQFTARVSLNLQNSSDFPYLGKAPNASGSTITSITPSGSTASIEVPGTPSVGTTLWIFNHPDTDSNSATTNDGSYVVTNVSSSGSGPTYITISTPGGGFGEPVSGGGIAILSENQPDVDDGVIGNGVGQSQVAEISYFLRGGNLYRRVLLVREDGDEINGEPQTANGNSMLWNLYTSGTSNYYPQGSNATASSFWDVADYSAFHYRGYYDGSNLQGQGVRFLSAKTALNNGADAPEILFDSSNRLPLTLGMPNFRFGFRPWNGTSTTGFPAEFVRNPGLNGTINDADDETKFLGRFNLQECSSSAFVYPGSQNVPAPNDPSQDVSPLSNSLISPFYAQVGTLTLDQPGASNEFGIVDQFEGQTYRRGEDILLSNVLSFDVKAYDPGSFKFADLGDDVESISGGYFRTGSVQNNAYSPAKRYRFDTWHPRANVGGDSDPPFFNPLTAVQIQINYRDVSTGTIRQTTIVQSLVDRN